MYKILNISDKLKKYETLAIVFLAIWIIYYLLVLMKTGFVSDDAYNSQIKGAIIQQGVTLHERILAEVLGWIQGAGRFLVFGWYMTYGTYYFTQDPIVVKALTIIIILVGILLFYVFSKRETHSPHLALLACLVMPIFFQFRYWHDPILAFTFLIPTVFALTMAALVLFQYHLDHGGSRYYVFSLCIYVVAVLTYEVTYPLCLLFFVIAYKRSNNLIKAVKQSIGFAIPVAVILAASGAYRLYFIKSSTYPGAELHLELGKLFSALAIQISSSVPLSYYYFNKQQFSTSLYSIDYLFLLLFGGGVAILLYKIGKSTVTPRLSGWATVGVILLFLPAVLSSLSGHQAELNLAGYGFGYITVYIQYFGLCILALSLISVIARKAKGRCLVALVVVLSLGATIIAAKNLKSNRAVALKSNETYKYPRHLLKSALQAGLADEMKESDFLFRNMRYASDWMWFYTTVTGKKIQTCDLSDKGNYQTCMKKIHPNDFVEQKSPHGLGVQFETFNQRDQPTWILSYNFDKKNGRLGRVILGKVDQILHDSKAIAPIQIIVRKISVYNLEKNRVESYNFQKLPINFLNLIKTEAEDASDVRTFDQFLLQPTDVDFKWIGDIHAREGNSSSNLRWSSGSATLRLYNFTKKPKWVDLSMELGTPTEPISKLEIKYNGVTEVLNLSQSRISYSKKLKLAPGVTEVEFISDAEPFQNGDPRNIVFGIFDFKLTTLSK